MKKIKHICIITYGYPSDKKPYLYTFVDKLVCAIADLNIKCTVINPVGVGLKYGKDNPPIRWSKKTESGNEIEVLCPRYTYFYTKKIGNYNTGRLTFYGFKRCVEKTLDKYKVNPDCLYGHFIFPAGATAALIGKERNLPAFFAYGESTPWGIEILGKDRVRKWLESINGVVAVSTAKKEELLEYDIVSERKISVFPNAIDDKVFYPRNKEEMRKKYNLPKDTFIIGYTGRFNQSKGVMRLVESTKEINAKLILIGGGELKPEGDNILFKGQLPHNEVPEMLSACDIFVLPTQNEGCCNAVIEAMGCGLPIISSDKSFNYDILSKETAILVDPDNISQIKEAICNMKNDKELINELGVKSIKKSKELTINQRAFNIVKWMENKV